MKIAFIGMMGSGKTSMAKEVSERLKLEYISIDEEIENESNMSITNIFDRYGEEYFRELESNTLSGRIDCKSCILDCGGGIILNKQNIVKLKENCFTIIFLDRKPSEILKDINIHNRPLIKFNPERIYDIYSERIDIYKSVADIIIENNTEYEETLIQIIDRINLIKDNNRT